MSEQYFLKSSRIGFREWTFDYMDLAIGLWRDAEVTNLIGGPFSIPKIHKRLSLEISILRNHSIQYWPIFLLETGVFIGCCGFWPYNNPDKKVYEIGFHIKKEFWRNGYASDAANGVIAYAFSRLDATALFASHHPENKVSTNLLKKLGFNCTYDEYYESTGLEQPSYLLNKKEVTL